MVRSASSASFVMDATDPDHLSVSIAVPAEHLDTDDLVRRSEVLKAISDLPGINATQIKTAVGGRAADVMATVKQLIEDNRVQVVHAAHGATRHYLTDPDALQI